MSNIFGNIAHGIEHLGQQVGNEVTDFFSPKPAPDPRQFSNGSPVPNQTTSGFSNMPNGSGNPLPGSGSGSGLSNSASGLSLAQRNQIQSAIASSPDLAGIWQTIQDVSGDAWGWLTTHLGDINWGDVAKNVGGFLKDHAKDILDAGNIYVQAQRQGKADSLANTAVQKAQESYDARAPLRAAGMAGMLDPSKNAPDLSALKTQSQNGLGVQAPTPGALPVAGINNAAQIASGPNAPNPFARALPLATNPTNGGGLTAPKPGAGTPALPIAAPPRQTEPQPTPGAQLPATNSPYGVVPPGPAMLPVSYGNGATTTAQTWAQPNAQGKFSAKQLTPNDATAMTPYGQVLPLAGR